MLFPLILTCFSGVCRYNTDFNEVREGVVLTLKDKKDWVKLVCQTWSSRLKYQGKQNPSRGREGC